jgi:hypothetical protein
MLFLKEKPKMRKVQLKGKAARAKKACKSCMQGNLTTIGLFVMADKPRISTST